jgi:glucose/arabinose dehydrogenase
MTGVRWLLAPLCAVAFLAACGGDSPATTQKSPASGRAPESKPAAAAPRRTGTIVKNLDVPWELAFLPDGSALLTERPGRVLWLDRNLKPAKRPAATVKVRAVGEGGLLGMAIDPQFASNRFVYLYRTTASGNEVLRYRYAAGRLTGPRLVVRGLRAGEIHDGGRLRFGPEGALYITTGEAGDGALAQDPQSLNGKILRVRDPRGAPVRPEVVSLGHRNVQGLDWQPGTDHLYATEFGPDHHDELNLILEGHNYGWPDFQGKAGPTPAIIDWYDVIAPSGATFVRKPGSSWTGNLLVACLRGEQLRRIVFDGGAVRSDQSLYQGRWGRLRQVVEGPDGAIYVLTNNTDGRGSPGPGDDRIIRIVPPPA